MTQFEEALSLIPSQFRGQPKLNAILKACATQVDEMIAMFGDLDSLSIETASGVNLDRIGDIVNLSRVDTFDILNASGIEVTDEVYRKCLTFKVLYNNTDATYYDIMKGLKLLWPDVEITYTEDPEEPATFRIHLNGVNLEDTDPASSAPFIIRPDGVQVILTNSFSHTTDTVDIESFGDEQIIYDAYVLYNGAYKFNGARAFGPVTTYENL